MKKPLFSIIIPTHNRAILLSESIQSVQKQSVTNWELLVIDDGSTDNTKSIINAIKDNRIKYYYQEHGERSHARNLGIEKATGDYICFLDDDDLFTADHLAYFSDHYKQNSKKEILRTGFYIRDKYGNQKMDVAYDEKKHKDPVNFMCHNMCGVGSLCIPNLYLEEDVFPTAFPHWQDTHLFIRLVAKYGMLQLPYRSYIYRLHQQMGSQKIESITQLSQRAAINVAAIEDLFQNHQTLTELYLESKVASYLIAEKYIEYACRAKQAGYEDLATELFKKSIAKGWQIKLLKNYFIYFFRSKKMSS